MGLVRGTNSIGLGLALGFTAWGVLTVLMFVQGQGSRIFSLSLVGVHVRLLVVIPLFFACESAMAPRMSSFARHLRNSGVVPEHEWPTLAGTLRRVEKLSASGLAELLCFLLALAGTLFEAFAGPSGGTGNRAAVLSLSGGKLTLISGLYLIYVLPLIRFLALRWLWRLGLWWYLLWRVGRLDLRLVPTHSDGAAGLGYLDLVQERFALLALAISAAFSSSFAEAISGGTMTFEALYRLIPAVAVLVALLFIGPLFLFGPKLAACRAAGLDEYMVLAARYARAFDRKWIRDPEPGASPLGTSDIQSLADLTNSISVIRNLRTVPVTRGLLTLMAVMVALPMVPLIFLKFPINEVLAQLFRVVTGL